MRALLVIVGLALVVPMLHGCTDGVEQIPLPTAPPEEKP
jgi:hypothetical protein